MVCDPNDLNLNPIVLPPPPFIIPFGFPFAPPAIPFPDISLPEGIPEDLIKLIRDFLAFIPGGPLRANITEFFKTVLDVISSLLNQLGPYLALYRFFIALLNMIGCSSQVIQALFA